MKLKKLFWNWTTAIKTFPVSHILLLVLTIIWIWEVEWFIDLDSPDLVLALILAFIISCYWPLFLIHSNLKNKNIINRILQIWSVIIWWLYNLILYNIDLDDLTYSESLLYIRIIPLAFLWIPLIIAIFHRKEESKIRFSWTNLFVSIVFGCIAWSIIRWWIAGALASIEALFDIDIDSDLYADLWFISDIQFLSHILRKFKPKIIRNSAISFEKSFLIIHFLTSCSNLSSNLWSLRNQNSHHMNPTKMNHCPIMNLIFFTLNN